MAADVLQGSLTIIMKRGMNFLADVASIAIQMAASGQYHRIENSSHWAMLDQPARINECLLECFAES